MTAPTVSYKPLWKTFIDKEMTNQDQRKTTGLSNAIITKLSHDKTVTIQIFAWLYGVLGCRMGNVPKASPAAETKGGNA